MVKCYAIVFFCFLNLFGHEFSVHFGLSGFKSFEGANYEGSGGIGVDDITSVDKTLSNSHFYGMNFNWELAESDTYLSLNYNRYESSATMFIEPIECRVIGNEFGIALKKKFEISELLSWSTGIGFELLTVTEDHAGWDDRSTYGPTPGLNIQLGIDYNVTQMLLLGIDTGYTLFRHPNLEINNEDYWTPSWFVQSGLGYLFGDPKKDNVEKPINQDVNNVTTSETQVSFGFGFSNIAKILKADLNYRYKINNYISSGIGIGIRQIRIDDFSERNYLPVSLNVKFKSQNIKFQPYFSLGLGYASFLSYDQNDQTYDGQNDGLLANLTLGFETLLKGHSSTRLNYGVDLEYQNEEFNTSISYVEKIKSIGLFVGLIYNF